MAERLNWVQFNTAVLAEENERVLLRWLDKLKREPKPHLQRMLRVHSRLNKLRAARERKELEALVGGKLAETTEEVKA